ncbi:MFS transporter [Pseudonocardia nematodicida]|uniref:MFS transporter n=1 Tax=Pseudonocardia nematodicida TaxID=1206997 RepID=A0ABV1KG41_9PSEU
MSAPDVDDPGRPVAGEPSPHDVRKATFSGAAGFFMETYDFTIYGLVAAYLTVEFFSTADSATSLLVTWAVFAIPFLVRPVGGVVLGSFADRIGRKTVMLLSVVAIAVATALIGLIPSYQTIGIIAPLAVLLCRLAQGFVYGGETAAAITFVGEWTPVRQRASRLALVQTGASVGNLFGSVCAFSLSFLLGPVLMQAWGWRVLFLLAIPLAGVAVYIRFKIGETPVFRRMQSTGDISSTPLRDAVADPATRGRMYQGALLGALMCAGFYVIYIQQPAYLVAEFGFSAQEGLLVTLVGLSLLVVLTPLFGLAADRYGRRAICVGTAGILALASVPLFVLIGSGTLGAAVAGVLLLTAPFAAHNALTLGAIFETLAARTRGTAFAISWGLTVAVFGGAAPFISTGLIALTGFAQSPALLISFAAVLSAVGYLRYSEPVE